MTQEELAALAGSHRDHIARLERDEVQKPQMSTIRKIAAALDVHPSQLVEEDED